MEEIFHHQIMKQFQDLMQNILLEKDNEESIEAKIWINTYWATMKNTTKWKSDIRESSMMSDINSIHIYLWQLCFLQAHINNKRMRSNLVMRDNLCLADIISTYINGPLTSRHNILVDDWTLQQIL